MSSIILTFLISLASILAIQGTNSSVYNTTVNLGSCSNFAIQAGTSVSFNGLLTTIAIGSVGVSPGTQITGNYALDDGAIEDNSSAAVQCAADTLVAYNQAAGATCGTILQSADLAGVTLYPGVYCSPTGNILISASTVTLDAKNDSSAVWLFQTATTLVTATATSFILQNGAKASNVFWQIGTSASIGYSSEFVGTILSYASISYDTTSVITGRALAQAAVSFSGGSTLTGFSNGVTSSPSTTPTMQSSLAAGNSYSPTTIPTNSPTGIPSIASTHSPTNVPSTAPSHSPSSISSSAPSLSSFNPSSQPSLLPSNNPMASVTISPSTAQAVIPSAVSTAPSYQPTYSYAVKSEESYRLSSGDISAIVICSVFGLFLLLSGIYYLMGRGNMSNDKPVGATPTNFEMVRGQEQA